jgi:ABC-type glycerol-3-phosphate transport system substrate-binding protein
LRDQELLWSERYLFNIVSPGLNFIQYYTDFETGPLFFEHIPLVNERGELLTYSWGSYALNANATPVEQALAWEFIKFINDADNSGAMSFNGLQQTNRNTFRKGVEAAMTRTSVFDGAIRYLHQFGWQTRLSEAEAVQNTTTLLESFGDMPMTKSRNIPHSIWAALFDALQLFHEGVVSAEQTAADLQNKIELMLMEMGR